MWEKELQAAIDAGLQAKAKIIICTVKDKNGIEQEIQSLY